MPHTGDILPGGKYAVVSCHVERPLDDAVWERFSALQKRRPGGFRIAALMRPADAGAGEEERAWLELTDGRRLLELPTTHSLGMLARGVLGRLPRVVHAYFHDYDLADPRRRAVLVAALTVLGRRRRTTDLGALQLG